MRRIAERAEVRVVGGNDDDAAAGTNQAVKLLHRAKHVIDVLDDVNRTERVERTVGERVGKTVQLAEDVGAAPRVPVDADGTRLLVDAAADVEYAHGPTVVVSGHGSTS